MRLAALSAAVLGVGMIASASQAALTFQAVRTSNATTISGVSFDRVVLYALADNATDLFAADLTVTSSVPNGLKFTATPGDPDAGTNDSVTYTGAQSALPTANRSRGDSIVFGTLAPGFPQPDPSTSFAQYQAGLTSFQIVGFDGRPAATTDVGVKAGPDLNGGKGAALFTAVIPSTATVSFAGTGGDDALGTPAYPILVTNAPGGVVPEPATLSAMGLAALGLIRRRK